MAIGWMWDYQVVELSGVPAEDEATLTNMARTDTGGEFLKPPAAVAIGRTA